MGKKMYIDLLQCLGSFQDGCCALQSVVLEKPGYKLMCMHSIFDRGLEPMDVIIIRIIPVYKSRVELKVIDQI